MYLIASLKKLLASVRQGAQEVGTQARLMFQTLLVAPWYIRLFALFAMLMVPVSFELLFHLGVQVLAHKGSVSSALVHRDAWGVPLGLGFYGALATPIFQFYKKHKALPKGREWDSNGGTAIGGVVWGFATAAVTTPLNIWLSTVLSKRYGELAFIPMTAAVVIVQAVFGSANTLFMALSGKKLDVASKARRRDEKLFRAACFSRADRRANRRSPLVRPLARKAWGLMALGFIMWALPVVLILVRPSLFAAWQGEAKLALTVVVIWGAKLMAEGPSGWLQFVGQNGYRPATEDDYLRMYTLILDLQGLTVVDHLLNILVASAFAEGLDVALGNHDNVVHGLWMTGITFFSGALVSALMASAAARLGHSKSRLVLNPLISFVEVEGRKSTFLKGAAYRGKLVLGQLYEVERKYRPQLVPKANFLDRVVLKTPLGIGLASA